MIWRRRKNIHICWKVYKIYTGLNAIRTIRYNVGIQKVIKKAIDKNKNIDKGTFFLSIGFQANKNSRLLNESWVYYFI